MRILDVLGCKAVCLLVALWLLCGVSTASAAVANDSSRFVTASLIVVTPGDAIYSRFGHVSLRMQCPSKDLDYCFTFESEPNRLKFLMGQSKAHFAAVPFDDFVKPYRTEGRGIRQYDLNLTTPEEQELWRMLDEDMVEEPHRQFNLIQNNCVSMSMFMIEASLRNEQIAFRQMPEQMSYINGDGIRFLSRRSPWLQFLLMTFVGSEADVYWQTEQRLSPELLGDIVTHAVIEDVNTHAERPLIEGKPRIIQQQTSVPEPSPFTPTRLAVGLLLLTLLITCLEWMKGWQRVARWFDVFLFAFQTLTGVLLVYSTLVAGLFGLHWNWYLLPFNPLPLLIWLLWRKRKKFYHVYLFYFVILCLFIVIAPVITTQADLPHLLIVGVMGVRCLSNYLKGKIQNKKIQ